MKKIIYDFDGTLTTASLPFYKFFELCNGPKNVEEWIKLADEKVKKYKTDIYKALYDVQFESIKEANLPLNNDTFLLGCDNVKYNPGVLEFFKEKDENKHYILTSGYDEFVMATSVAPYIDKVYGTSYLYENNEAIEIKELMSDKKKPEKIDLIAAGDFSNIIYVGDGFTDLYAFKHVIKNGGTAVLIHQPNDDSVYEKLKEEHLDLKYFDADFTKNSDLYNFLKR